VIAISTERGLTERSAERPEPYVRFGSKADMAALLTDVRFGSKADIRQCPGNVRFTPESGHPQLIQGRAPIFIAPGGKRDLHRPIDDQRPLAPDGPSDRASGPADLCRQRAAHCNKAARGCVINRRSRVRVLVSVHVPKICSLEPSTGFNGKAIVLRSSSGSFAN